MKWQPEEIVQINFRATTTFRDFLEKDAKDRHFRSIQELILDVLRTYKEQKEQASVEPVAT